MLRTLPTSWFSSSFNVLDGDKQLALINMARMREAGTFVLDGASFKVYRQKRFSGAFVLEHDGSVVASASKPSAWKRALEVEYGNKHYLLKPESSWGRSFMLLDGETSIGAMRPAHSLSRKANADFPDSIPLPVRLFMVWLTMILWNRDDAAAGAVAAGA